MKTYVPGSGPRLVAEARRLIAADDGRAPLVAETPAERRALLAFRACHGSWVWASIALDYGNALEGPPRRAEDPSAETAPADPAPPRRQRRGPPRPPALPPNVLPFRRPR